MEETGGFNLNYLTATSLNAAPIADFTSSCAGLSCMFDASGSSDPDGAVVGYNWEFGDGATATGVAATHVYTTGGAYVVKVTVTDNGGATMSMTGTVSASQPPTAAFTVSCVGGNCFDIYGSSDPDGSIVSYAWTFGDSAIASGETTSHIYTATNTYSVTLTVTDDAGASTSVSQDVSVTQSPPSAAFTFTCAVLTCTLDGSTSSDSDGTVANYAWDFGDGTSGSGASATQTYATGGVFAVTLTVTDNSGGSDSDTQNVTVTQSPTASFTFNCASQTCSFDGSGSNDPDGTIAGYAWDFGDGVTGTGASPAHSYAFSGQYTVTLTVTDAAGATGITANPAAVAVALPTTLQAEDYKVGGSGVGFSDTTAGNTGNAYRTDAVDIQATTDTGGVTTLAGRQLASGWRGMSACRRPPSTPSRRASPLRPRAHAFIWRWMAST